MKKDQEKKEGSKAGKKKNQPPMPAWFGLFSIFLPSLFLFSLNPYNRYPLPE